MALLPTIPTSFVPHPSGATSRRLSSSLTGVFGFFAYAVFGIVFILALGVFLYSRFLATNQAAKDALLVKAEAAIDQTTIESFVRLRNRLDIGSALLKKHVAFSNFFSPFETLLPTGVRFSSLHLSIDSSGTTKVDGSGIAKSFNSLAVVSTSFATKDSIKDAIFSKISVNKDNSVSFDLSATLDSKLVTFSP